MSHDQIDLSTNDILVIDDAPDNLRILSTILSNRGFRVRKSLDGRGAITSAKVNPPSIILLDIRLPEIDGYEVCQILKADPNTSHIPVIFISALDDISDKLKAFKSGGIDYITKPFQEEEVLVRVETQLKLQKLQCQLIQRNNDLARFNRELEQFAYVVSHDLQQPLQTMIGFAQLLALKHQHNLDETSHEYLQGIIESGRRAQQLIQDLLSYSQIEHQAQKLESVDCNLILAEVLNNLQTVISAKNVHLTSETLPVITGNKIQLIQLFQNLIENAIKFVPSNRSPHVRLTVSKQDCEWLFEVRDNGIGIQSENLESIFEVFQRLHTSDEYPGTGIGLAICKKIVEFHNGRIWVQSQPNIGSSFYFTLAELSNKGTNQ
ncbi:bacteriophytochrome (light-regulated signal transduction histidine kinase) [Leptolyngbyaceae cyanobacterium JSC-12]|nr:bacteriophytochrome (light-regulated signal transduction histidine kinase) [Leptolyngbyaceae cyanobacterium JSC-12]